MVCIKAILGGKWATSSKNKIFPLASFQGEAMCAYNCISISLNIGQAMGEIDIIHLSEITFKKTNSSKSSNMRKRLLIFELFFLDESWKLIENTNFKVVIMHLVEPSKTRLGGVHLIMPKAVNGQGWAGCLHFTYSLMRTNKVQKCLLWRIRILQGSAVESYYLI